MYDIVVLGTGGVGSSAVYHAARRGARTLGLDRFPGGHDRGSSHGHTRIIRLAYFEHPDYVPLLRRAYSLWADLEATVEETLYHEVGLLQVGPPDGMVVPGVLRSAALHNLEVERLDAGEVTRRFPGFQVPEGYAAVFERRAGYLLVERCVLAHQEAARRLGAELRHGVTIVGLRREPGHVVVQTTDGEIPARQVIVTAGAWAGGILADAGLQVRVLRKHLHWYATSGSQFWPGLGGCTFFYEVPEGEFYGFPQIDGDGLKVAEHSGGETVADPLTVSRDVDPVDRRRVESFAARYMRGVLPEPRRHDICFYTMSPDGHFLIDHHPHDERIVFAAGLSGHGFKFTSVLGEQLVSMALDRRPTLPIEFLKAGR